MTSKSGNRFTSKARRKGNVYYQEIDRAIADVLSQIDRLSNGQLKREVEKRCENKIPSKTWSTHLKKMQTENYLLKDDTLQRNQKVFYSLTEYAKELRDLRLLRTDPKRVAFLQIYAILFFSMIIEGTTYAGDDLENILNEIHANRQQLCIDFIRKKPIEIEEKYHYMYEMPLQYNAPEMPLQVFIATHYKPTSLGVNIIESTGYRENIFYKNRVEYTTYTYTVPGVSVEDLAQKYYTFKPCMADCESALELLLRRELVKPVMDFRGKTRYVIADPELTNFATELYWFCDLENEFLNIKWQRLIPTFNEEQSRKFLFSEETMSKKFFMHRELQRHQFKQAMKNKNNNHQNLVQTESDKLQEFEKLRIRLLKQVYLNKKYHSIIDRYPFLRQIIQIISPSLSEIIPRADNLESTTK